MTSKALKAKRPKRLQRPWPVGLPVGPPDGRSDSDPCTCLAIPTLYKQAASFQTRLLLVALPSGCKQGNALHASMHHWLLYHIFGRSLVSNSPRFLSMSDFYNSFKKNGISHSCFVM